VSPHPIINDIKLNSRPDLRVAVHLHKDFLELNEIKDIVVRDRDDSNISCSHGFTEASSPDFSAGRITRFTLLRVRMNVDLHGGIQYFLYHAA
jgi:hypothetical protein